MGRMQDANHIKVKGQKYPFVSVIKGEDTIHLTDLSVSTQGGIVFIREKGMILTADQANVLASRLLELARELKSKKGIDKLE